MKILLKSMRKRRGWSQGELSVRSGIPQPMISEIERNIVQNPGVLTLYKLTTALRCSIDDLISDEEPERKAE